MNKKRRVHPADPDTARAHSDTQWVFYVFGRTAPKNAKIAAARRKELTRIMLVIDELKQIDALNARDVLPPMPSLPIVNRPRSICTDNVKPAPDGAAIMRRIERLNRKPKA